MVQAVVEESKIGAAEDGYVTDLVPEIVAELSWGELGSREKVESEIDTMLATVREFWNMEPDAVMRMSSALSARCTEMSVYFYRFEGRREWKQVRTMQVEKLLAEIDRQFRMSSRLVEIRRQDMETMRG